MKCVFKTLYILLIQCIVHICSYLQCRFSTYQPCLLQYLFLFQPLHMIHFETFLLITLSKKIFLKNQTECYLFSTLLSISHNKNLMWNKNVRGNLTGQILLLRQVQCIIKSANKMGAINNDKENKILSSWSNHFSK